jgi:hypothetical protein
MKFGIEILLMFGKKTGKYKNPYQLSIHPARMGISKLVQGD